MTGADVDRWVDDVVAQFCHAEHAGGHRGREKRDPALVRWVLDTLAEAGCPVTAGVLEAIDRRRAVTR